MKLPGYRNGSAGGVFCAPSASLADEFGSCTGFSSHDSEGDIMATATQSVLIRGLDAEKRSGASRQFADAQRRDIAGRDDEVALVLAAKSEDGHAFEILIERYQRRMLAVARRFARTREDAEDIVQQSFQKAFVHLHKFEGKSSLSTWLTRIAINEALMWLRRGHGLREVSIDDLSGNEETALRPEMRDSRAGPESAFLQGERSRILSAAMDRLTPRTRKAIELRELGELSTKEAARVMGLSEGAVKTRVFHGRKKLLQILERESAWISGKQSLRASRKANGLSRRRMTPVPLQRPMAGALSTVLLALGVSLFSFGCGEKNAQAGKPAAVDVEVVQVEQKDIPIYGEWIGTLDGLENADVKAQVTGYLLKQAYAEGSFVKRGQLLFQIDPRPFQAALDSANALLMEAQAQLTNAEAAQLQAQLNVNKYTPLAQEQAATQQDLDNAVQTNVAAKATVLNSKAAIQAAEAALKSAQINLDFTRLTAPINGIAGQAQLQVGALVNTSSSAITTVSTVDPIKVFFTVSEQEYLAFNREYPTEATREAEERHMPLELILAGGTTYSKKGKISFADRAVNQNTGAIRIAGLFANPGNILRPGQYARVRAATSIRRGALLVPQRAVSELQGTYQVAVVDSNNKVSIATVKVGERAGPMWIIEEGLKPGDRVVTAGVQKVRPGAQVNPKPFSPGPTDGKRN
jgi:membrane fusion protein (multidrug efflux system)